MAAGNARALQTAVYGRLTDALAAAAPGGGPIMVVDHVPADPSQMHVRLEGASMLPVETKDGSRGARHRFTVRAFDEAKRDATSGAGQAFVTGVQGIVIDALEGWRPIAGRARLRLLEARIQPAETGTGFDAVTRFEIYLGDGT